RRIPSGRSAIVRSFVPTLTFFNWPTWISSSGNPASGTSRVSNPRSVPTNRTSAPCASRNSRAIASAGITCPPVPPPAISTLKLDRSPTLIDLTRDIQQHAHTRQRNKKRSTARRDKRQRNSLRRQQRQHHAHVEESLDQNRRRNTKRQKPRKRIGRKECRPQPPIAQPDKQTEDQQSPNQTKLLADIREDKIRLHLGKIEQLLPSLHQTQPANSTSPHRNQRLQNMKSASPRVSLRINKRQHPRPSKRHMEQHEVQHRSSHSRTNRKILRPSPGQVQHQRSHRHANHPRTQVRLLQYQRCKQQRHRDRTQDRSLPVVHLVNPRLQKVRKEQHQHWLRQLGRLKRKQIAKPHPAMRIMRVPHRKHAHQQQHRQRHRRKHHPRIVIPAVVHLHQRHHRQQAKDCPHRLLHHVGIRRPKARLRHHRRRRKHHHQSKQHQQQHHSEEPLVPPYSLRHAIPSAATLARLNYFA